MQINDSQHNNTIILNVTELKIVTLLGTAFTVNRLRIMILSIKALNITTDITTQHNATLSITTLSIAKLLRTPLSIRTLSMTTFSMTILSITTLSTDEFSIMLLQGILKGEVSLYH